MQAAASRVQRLCLNDISFNNDDNRADKKDIHLDVKLA